MQDPQNLNNPRPAKRPRTPAQIAASRANGKKSHGPTTPEGLQKCTLAATASSASQSQFKHSQLAETVLLTGESRAAFHALLNRYIATFKPVSEPEHNVIQQMVVAYWQKLRAWSTHQTAFNCEIARQDPSLPHALKVAEAERAAAAALSDTNTQRFDRQFRNAIRDLRLLRDLRGLTTDLTPITLPLSFALYDDPADQSRENE